MCALLLVPFNRREIKEPYYRESIFCDTRVYNLVNCTVHSNCMVQTLYLGQPINVYTGVDSFLQAKIKEQLYRESILCGTRVLYLVSCTEHSNCMILTLYLLQLLDVCTAVGYFQ